MKLYSLITEAKKDEVKKDLMSKFPEAENYIDMAISYDPTGYKYMNYIKSSFEDLYPILESWGNLEKLSDYFQNVAWFENNYKKIKADYIDDIYELAKSDNVTGNMLSQISSIDPEKIKDINSWPIRTLKYLRAYVDTKKTNKQIEKEAKEGSDVVFDDPKKGTVVVDVFTHSASCYYGRNTKWCISMEKQPNYFFKESEDYKLYFVVDKKRVREKMAVQIPKRKTVLPKVWNEIDREVSFNYLYDLYPETQVFFDTLLPSTNIISFLEDLTVDDVRKFRWNETYPDEMISSMAVVDDEIKLKIKFSSTEYWDMFFTDDDDYDRAIIAHVYSSYGSDWEFFDSYTASSDWDEGYLWNYATDEQKEKIKELSKILFPKYQQQLENQPFEDLPREFQKMFQDRFKSEVEDIISEYFYMRNGEMEDSITEFLDEHYCDVFEKYGGVSQSCFYSYIFPRDGMVKLLTDYRSNSIYSSLSMYVRTEIDPINDLMDVAYQGTTNYDSSRITTIQNRYDDVIEKMEEIIGSDDNEQYQFRMDEYDKFNKFLKKKNIRIGVIYDLPADDDYTFAIDDVDFESGKVNVTVSSKITNNSKKYSPTYEEFTTLLFNYQLFR